MAEFVLHPTTKAELAQFTNRPSHAVLITGPEGIGKMTIAHHITKTALSLADDEAIDRYPYFRQIMPDGQSISIDAIRELLGFTKLKIARSNRHISRIIVIDEAHTLTTEAQNALLKLLEEPPEGTLFILTASHLQGLLPTIRSRAQQLSVKQPNRADLEQHFTALGHDSQQVRSSYLMSGGLPGLMHALLSDSESHPLLKAVEQARGLLRATTFERLTLVDSLSKQKAECMRLLFVMQQMAHAALTQAADKNATAQSVTQWHRVMAAAYEAQTALQENAQAKLVLTNLMLSF